MKVLVFLLISSLASSAWTAKVLLDNKGPAPKPKPSPKPWKPPPHCPGGNCRESKGNDTHLELGACCFGHTCLASGVPEHRCRGDWAGPDTACEDCERLRPCCDETTGECTTEFCSDCFFNGGKPVEYCEQCEKKPTPAPQPTPKTKPTSTTTTKPTPKPSTSKPGPPDGACCLPDGTCGEKTQAECHDHHGVFRGDYTWCEADTCKRKCCDGTLACTIVDAPSDCHGRLGAFATECDNTDDECGVTCCVKEKCVVAKSVEDCEACDGRPQLSNDCDDEGFSCGGACCRPDRPCVFTETRRACAAARAARPRASACKPRRRSATQSLACTRATTQRASRRLSWRRPCRASASHRHRPASA